MVERLKRTVLLVFASLFLLSTCIHLEIPASAQIVNNPYELVVATIGEPDTVDPAWAYGTASQGLIFNVYETLIFYDRESVDEFVPMLATDWWISSDGLTYTFRIREGVKFHSYLYGWKLTTEDVEYSFERVMVYDWAGGSAWLLYESLLDVWEANLTDPAFGQKIDNAVQRNDTHVWFKLAQPYAPFLKILCQPGCSIVNKPFCVAHGDWPGTWNNWKSYHERDDSPLDDPEPVMCGTGPYKFDRWIEGDEWSVVKFDDYWGGWPAPGCRGYVERVTVETIDDWETRKTSFLYGYHDIVYVSRAYMNEVLGQPGIRCVYPLPLLSCYGIFFNYNVSLRSYYLKPPYSVELGYGELSESGIPPDFFSDVDVRKGFAYSINYTEYAQILTSHPWYGEYLYPGTPAIIGLPYRNPEQEKYEFNPTEAEEHFKKAWNGRLWSAGFNLTIVHSHASYYRIILLEMLKSKIESLNSRFHVQVLDLGPWVDAYYPMLMEDMLPVFVVGTFDAAYPDIHYLFYAFMHSEAGINKYQRHSNPTIDALIDEGLHTLNETGRREIYYELQQIYFEDCPSVAISQPVGRHWERTWVQGWYHNPAYASAYAYDLYFYQLWKEDLPPEDLNMDGTVNILDVAVAAQAFASFCHLPVVHPRWNSRADCNQDQKVNIHDIAAIAKKFGPQTVPWHPP